MAYNVKLTIRHGEVTGQFDFPADRLKPLGGLPSGKPYKFTVEGPGGPGSRTIIIKPYYRRFIAGDLHIFAVEVPSERN